MSNKVKFLTIVTLSIIVGIVCGYFLKTYTFTKDRASIAQTPLRLDLSQDPKKVKKVEEDESKKAIGVITKYVNSVNTKNSKDFRATLKFEASVTDDVIEDILKNGEVCNIAYIDIQGKIDKDVFGIMVLESKNLKAYHFHITDNIITNIHTLPDNENDCKNYKSLQKYSILKEYKYNEPDLSKK